ncbi:MAG: HAMP domain-containing histidine kinase [Flavobacteriaceae bacterium]|nr:HAMP domain-containing histidine kinase [Flavobacteriaceae bacterium]
MKKIDRLYNPFFVTLFSLIVSLAIYSLIAFSFKLEDVVIGLIISAIIPIAVAFPVSTVMIKYHKKIHAQKIKLAELDSINKKLFSIIAHDIKNPIHTLKGMVDLLTGNHLSIDEAKEHLVSLSKRLDSVLNFLEELLDWSKRQTQKDTVVHLLFNCEEVIHSVTNLLDKERVQKSIHLTLENIKQTIFTDKDMYAFLVRNLYSNALKFTPENGSIKISTATKKNQHLTIIEDSGVGISKEDLDKILDKNKWFTQKGTSNELGTGFGINTCMNYLQGINGELFIESSLGNGTKITIAIPQKSPN